MHDATSAGSWGPRGLQRQVRATIATGLTAMASVLAAASSVAETIAKELRLSLDEDVELPPRRSAPSGPADRGVPVAPAGRPDGLGAGAAAADDGPTVRIVDAPSRAARSSAAARRAGAVAPSSTAGASTPPSTPDAAPSGPATGAPVANGPSPWVDDVAAEVAGGTVRDAIARLDGLTPTQLRALERHERAHRGRVTLLRAVGEELSRRG